MKKTLLTLFVLTIHFAVFSQQFADKEFYLIDSLILEDLIESDSLLLEKHLKAYHSKNTIQKIDHLDSIIEFSNDVFIYEAYNKPYWQDAKKYVNQFEEGTNEWKIAMKHYGNAINNNALKFDYDENLDSALYYYKIALEIYQEVEDNQSIGETMNMMHVVYRNMDKYYESIEIVNESFKYLDTNQINTAICYTNYSNFHFGQGNYEEAIFFNTKALNIAKALNGKLEILNALTNIASIKRYQGKLTEADSIIKESVVIMNSIENIRPYDYIFTLEELGEILLKQNKLDTAQIVLENTLNIAKENDFKYIFLLANSGLAKVATLKGDYNKSKTYATISYEMATKYELYDHIGLALENLMIEAEYRKDFELALKYQKEYHEVKYKTKNEKKKKASLTQAIQYEYEKQKEIASIESKSKIALIEQQKQKTRLGLIGATIITLLISVFSIFTYNRLKFIKSQKIKLDDAYLKLEESTKNELAVSNLKALKSQMNPHFIFNLLNSIQALVLKGDVDASYTYMTKFATLVRQTLHFSDADLVELDEEIDLLRIYLDLEKLRFSKDFEYQIIDNDIEGIEIPPLLIQPFIENALVHGLLHKEGKKTLKLEFQITDKLICTITDNGIGRAKSKAIKERQKSNHQSFSTQAIEKRFKILSETYKGEFGFRYEDIFEGDLLIATQVKLSIPYKQVF